MDQRSPLTQIDEVRALVIKMYNEGATYVEIANVLGRSRSAAAGLVSRLRDRGFLNQVPRRYASRIPKVKRVLVQSVPRAAIMPMPQPEPKPLKRIRLRLVTEATAVTFAELDKHHCKFPLGDPRLSDFRFCGANRAGEKSPYCVWHTKITCRKSFYQMGKRPQPE